MKYILDASAIISGFVDNGYTVPEVIQEIRDYSSEFTMESLIASGKLQIEEPSEEAVSEVECAVGKTKDTLSATDVKVVALALDLDGCVVSGDYGIQNVCEVLDVPYESAGVKGIEEIFRWEFVCVGCGRKFGHALTECPFCGNRVIRRRSIQRKSQMTGCRKREKASGE
ncbi:MAG: hypothetical protein HXS52_10775 [Theionarchaea archaeon]|nr:hypothetical protein [Theionarchaea archaeon]MBU7038403.1 hypothetical protein [Theionarchaea archaeon]